MRETIKMLPKITALDISDRFEKAVMTLKRLPRVKVQTHFNSWPDIVRNTTELMCNEKPKMKLPPPSAESISQMEECFEWICWLDDETERHIVWLRANRVYWKQICARVGFGRNKAWQIYTCGLLKIATRLNAKQMSKINQCLTCSDKKTVNTEDKI